jgi:tRNA threonylcarbamoyl adenosine modification protein (Sua5/YciO/YrdC/YwlC family)
MSRVLTIRADDPDPGHILAAAAAIAEGGLVVLPTETVYGIACRPDDPVATSRLFAAKARPAELNLPALAATGREAFELGATNGRAGALAEAFWPGPLTMVLGRTERSAGWDLGQERSTIGLRVPDHPVALALLRLAGPLAVTSANRSGRPPAATAEELRDVFGDAVAVYLVVDEPLPPHVHGASTVVDLTGEGLRVLRPGPIAPADLARIVAGTPSESDSIH